MIFQYVSLTVLDAIGSIILYVLNHRSMEELSVPLIIVPLICVSMEFPLINAFPPIAPVIPYLYAKFSIIPFFVVLLPFPYRFELELLE